MPKPSFSQEKTAIIQAPSHNKLQTIAGNPKYAKRNKHLLES